MKQFFKALQSPEKRVRESIIDNLDGHIASILQDESILPVRAHHLRNIFSHKQAVTGTDITRLPGIKKASRICIERELGMIKNAMKKQPGYASELTGEHYENLERFLLGSLKTTLPFIAGNKPNRLVNIWNFPDSICQSTDNGLFGHCHSDPHYPYVTNSGKYHLGSDAMITNRYLSIARAHGMLPVNLKTTRFMSTEEIQKTLQGDKYGNISSGFGISINPDFTDNKGNVARPTTQVVHNIEGVNKIAPQLLALTEPQLCGYEA